MGYVLPGNTISMRPGVVALLKEGRTGQISDGGVKGDPSTQLVIRAADIRLPFDEPTRLPALAHPSTGRRPQWTSNSKRGRLSQSVEHLGPPQRLGQELDRFEDHLPRAPSPPLTALQQNRFVPNAERGDHGVGRDSAR
ncbi:hypothetical protein GCM10010483_48840 [Actinokineospora diospyrosa]